MIRTTLLAGLVLFATAPAFAGSPPVKIPATPAEVEARCTAAGASAEAIATDGLTGCQNTETGAAVLCTGDQCTDYFADPRYKKIKQLLDANRTRPQQRAL